MVDVATRRVRYVRSRLGVAACCAIVSLLATAGPAAAQIPNDASAVDQYVEAPPEVSGSIPSAGGSGAGGPGAGAVIPPGLQQRIARLGGDDAGTLQQVLTSPVYGAPQRKLGEPSSGGGQARYPDGLEAGPGGGDVSVGDALGAAVSAVQGGDAGRLFGLLVALLGISFAALAAAGLRQRRGAA